jgi:hypothetical protein
VECSGKGIEFRRVAFRIVGKPNVAAPVQNQGMRTFRQVPLVRELIVLYLAGPGIEPPNRAFRSRIIGKPNIPFLVDANIMCRTPILVMAPPLD